ncbi:MAG: hypothetical protein LBB63_03180 [Holosporaceae bacterium]|jgi:hypothetical protein|nr:hypothetical protein [Holosporaceae bacterium]
MKISKQPVAVVAICAVMIYCASLLQENRTAAPVEFSQPKTVNHIFMSEEQQDKTPVPLDENIPPLRIRESSLLNEDEMEFYKKNTWNPKKTLEQNRRMLTDNFMKTCVERVVDFLSMDKGVVLQVASQSQGIFLESAKIEEFRECDVARVIYLMTDSPLFCRLIRSILTKYKTMTYRPQKAIFLMTKGEANHSTYSALHYVINLRTLDHTILSALDCSEQKIMFGATVFHEMLHWYHNVANFEDCRRRQKSDDCIRHRLSSIGYGGFSPAYVDKIARYFTNDEEYYAMYGLKKENGELLLDILCEAAYSNERYGYIRGSHAVFRRHFPDERNFLLNSRDSSLLKFFQIAPIPEFGKGDFKCSDLNGDEAT